MSHKVNKHCLLLLGTAGGDTAALSVCREVLTWCQLSVWVRGMLLSVSVWTQGTRGSQPWTMSGEHCTLVHSEHNFPSLPNHSLSWPEMMGWAGCGVRGRETSSHVTEEAVSWSLIIMISLSSLWSLGSWHWAVSAHGDSQCPVRPLQYSPSDSGPSHLPSIRTFKFKSHIKIKSKSLIFKRLDTVELFTLAA